MSVFRLFPLGYPIIVSVDITMESDGMSTQLIITCVSTGGPATAVTWTRESDTLTEGTETVLDDRVTAQYTHTLTVTETGLLQYFYRCEVSNNKPSSATVEIYALFTLSFNYGMSMHI